MLLLRCGVWLYRTRRAPVDQVQRYNRRGLAEKEFRMRSLLLKSALILTVVVSWSGVPTAERAAAMEGTNPAFKSIGPLTFSPDGVLFAGDTQSAAIFALDLGKAAAGGAPGAK